MLKIKKIKKYMNNNQLDKSTQGGRISKSPKPVIFELGTVAGLFFNDEGIHLLFRDDFIQLGEAHTIENDRANIIIALYITDTDYFELRFVITTTRGTEHMSTYDKLENLESFQLKKWMHIVLCDKKRKISLIKRYPELYSFDATHFLA